MGTKTIRSWEEAEKPREKLVSQGKHSLTNTELIAILFRTGCGRDTAVDLARKVLGTAGNDLIRLSKYSVPELCKVDGVGITKSTCLLAALELGARKTRSATRIDSRVTSSNSAYSHMVNNLADLSHEEFWLLLLDRSNNVIRKVQLSKGGLSGTVVDPKMVFKIAVDNLASGLILFHNHPSGNLKASESDIKLTARMKKAGDLMDIVVLDHIIITSQGYFSFADQGMM